jgi:hypothetical protein
MSKTKTESTGTDNDTPPGTSPSRWKLEKAEKKQNKKPSISKKESCPKNDEKKFASVYVDAIAKIDKLNSDFKKAGTIFIKKKAEVVRDLANTMKRLEYPVDAIANEIVHQLKGKASRSWIYEVLADEYKDKAHQDARKRGHKVDPLADRQEQDLATPSSHGDEVATAKVALQQERKQLLMVGADGHETIDAESESESENLGDLPSTGKGKQGPFPPKQQQNATTESKSKIENPTKGPVQILINRDELSEKMTKLPKDIKNFWLCGRIENDKLLDMTLEREVQ